MFRNSFLQTNGMNDIIPLNDSDIVEELKPGPLEAFTDVIQALAAESYGSINPIRSYTTMSLSSSPIPYKDTVC